MGKCMDTFVNKLMAVGNLGKEEFTELLKFRNIETTEYLNEKACLVRQKVKGNKIQLWGRVPISSYCRYDCKMCGLRRDNQFAIRFRMETSLIVDCCLDFARRGITNFLLESGDDTYYTEQWVEEILTALKDAVKGCRIILALGEKTESAYRRWRANGVEGYLLRHGSAEEQHFKKIYPSNMSLLLRKQQLWQLKNIGYKVGTGFLIGIPYQGIANVLEDIQFIKSFGASIVDMGAFVPARHTPFERERSGNGDMTTYIMAIFRLMLPDAMIIANPTLDCVLRDGRMQAVQAGADAVIVDLDIKAVIEGYGVYERKNGRFLLPMDQVDEIRGQIQVMGLDSD
ncbi:MAG: [FeFe] hydrogenase H-cluster radical SAM maturase HydE [Lachnospiraceae bacterium]|nr:[FeFe] hydrogenase H-cluster radical SAM maturase HydE [Lachnospiraceae bacterium]